MRSMNIVRIVLLTAVVFTVGCSSNNKGKIEGTKWSVIDQTVKGKHIPAGSMELEFKSDGTLLYRAGPATHKGTYTLGWGDRVTFHLDEKLGDSKTHAQTIIINGDRLTLRDSDGTEGVFAKVK